MVLGDGSQIALNSYVAVFREATFGTHPATLATNSTAIEFSTCNIRSEINSQKIDTKGHRGFTKRVQLEKTVSGTLEAYLNPIESPLLIGVAMGGGIVSNSLTGGAFTHSISTGNITDTSPSSVAFTMRKGEEVFQFVGGRVDNCKITANVGEVAKISYDMIFKDSTLGATDIASNLSYTSVLPFTFVEGVFRYQASEAASDTTTAEERITGFELNIKNGLKGDANARELGSRLLRVLPPTRRDIEFKVTQRWDTSTIYDRFVQATEGSVRLVFTGQSITAEHNHKMEIIIPRLYNKTGDTEVAGSDDVLMSEVVFDAILNTTTSGREIGITIINNVDSYTSI